MKPKLLFILFPPLFFLNGFLQDKFGNQTETHFFVTNGISNMRYDGGLQGQEINSSEATEPFLKMKN